MSRDLLAIAGITIGIANVMAGKGRMPKGPSLEGLEDMDPDATVNIYGFSVKVADVRRVLGEGDRNAKIEELKRKAQDPEFMAKLRRELGIDEDEYGAQLPTRWCHSPRKLSWDDIIGDVAPSRIFTETALADPRRYWVRHDPLASRLLGPPSGFSVDAEKNEMTKVQSGLASVTASGPIAPTEHTLSVPMAKSIYGLSALMMEIYGPKLFGALGMGNMYIGTLTEEALEKLFADEPDNAPVGFVAGAFSPRSGKLLLVDEPYGAVAYLHEIWHRVDHAIGQRMVWQVMPESRQLAPDWIDLNAVMSTGMGGTALGALASLLESFWADYLKHIFLDSMLCGDYGRAMFVQEMGAYLSSPDETFARMGQQLTLHFAKWAKLPFHTTIGADFIPGGKVDLMADMFIASMLLSAFGHGCNDVRPFHEARQMHEAVEDMSPKVRAVGRRLLPVLRKCYGEYHAERLKAVVQNSAAYHTA